MNRLLVERVIAVVLVLLSFFAGYLWKQHANLSSIGAARAHDVTSGKRASGERASTAAAPAASVGAEGLKATRRAGDAHSAEDIRHQMTAAFRTRIMAEKFMELATVLQHLSPDNWRGALQAFDDARKQGEDNPEAWAFFVRRAGEIIGKDAVAYFVESNNLEAARSALTGWASTNPAAALEWIGKEARAETRQLIVGAAIRGLALSEPDLAASALEGISIERRKNYVHDFVASVARGASMPQTEEIVNGLIRRAAANGEAGDDYVKEIFSDFTELKARRAAISGDTTGLTDWVKQNLNQPYADASIIRGAAEQLARVDATRALGWLDSLLAAGVGADPRVPMGYGSVVAIWADKEGAAPVGRWLASNATHPRYDYMAAPYAAWLAKSDAAEASRLAGTIKDPAWRASTQKSIAEITAPKTQAKRK